MTYLKPAAIMIIAACLASCGGGGDSAVNRDDVVARVGKTVLTLPELKEKVPYGLSSADSLRFVNAYVRQWIDSRIIGEIAARNIPDLSEIEEKVSDYRNELVMMEYRRLMYEQNMPEELSADSLQAYYDRHKDEFRLDAPLIKGIYVKLPDNAERIADVRKWVKSGSEDDLDNLEKYHFDNSKVMEYDYFADDWVDWNRVAGRMPLDFDASPEMLSGWNKVMEMSRNGYVYMLKVIRVLPKGEPAPFESVKDNIREYIAGSMRLEYDRRLRQRLYEEGLKNGDVELNVELGVAGSSMITE